MWFSLSKLSCGDVWISQWPGWIIRIKIRAKRIFTRFENYDFRNSLQYGPQGTSECLLHPYCLLLLYKHEMISEVKCIYCNNWQLFWIWTKEVENPSIYSKYAFVQIKDKAILLMVRCYIYFVLIILHAIMPRSHFLDHLIINKILRMLLQLWN